MFRWVNGIVVACVCFRWLVGTSQYSDLHDYIKEVLIGNKINVYLHRTIYLLTRLLIRAKLYKVEPVAIKEVLCFHSHFSSDWACSPAFSCVHVVIPFSPCWKYILGQKVLCGEGRTDVMCTCSCKNSGLKTRNFISYTEMPLSSFYKKKPSVFSLTFPDIGLILSPLSVSQ